MLIRISTLTVVGDTIKFSEIAQPALFSKRNNFTHNQRKSFTKLKLNYNNISAFVNTAN
jgi:hypothetical protein